MSNNTHEDSLPNLPADHPSDPSPAPKRAPRKTAAKKTAAKKVVKKMAVTRDRKSTRLNSSH